ncbi:MAG: PspC domain-containing protein [Firmicutes bacterium]|nr:PspC domain-containing protein [Bacillota bacterium]MBR0516657.1 PspC domain-containing protein [Bacillota bacterium]
MEYKRLYKSSTDKAIFGVCGGIAEYFGIDSLIVRLVLVLFTLAFGAGLLFYIIAALIMPKRPEDGGPQVYPQPPEPGAYNAGGTTYVNRASAEPMPQEVTRSAVPQEEPADPVSKAWAKERETQEGRGAAAGAPKADSKPEPPKQETPQPSSEEPQAKRSYQAYETYQQPRQSAQQYSRQAPAGRDHTRTVLGIILMLIGAFVLVKVFLPRFDTRILFAVCMLVAGGLLIAKKD